VSSPKILAFAYACEPGKGSEPGAGWLWARMLGRVGETWVITRSNNREAIEGALGRAPEDSNLHFVYVDLPAWARFWKRGQRGLRLYYVLWQGAALVEARRLQKSIRFDFVWHLTMATIWLGSGAALIDLPFVYGPVGGGVRTSWPLMRALGVKGALFEVARELTRIGHRYMNPLARLTWRRAELILVQNHETRDWLPRSHRHKAEIFQNALLVEPSGLRAIRGGSPPTAFFAGRLLAWKGLALALRAVAVLPEWRFVICGTGPDEARLRRLARRLGVEPRVEFLGWRPREEVIRLLEKADVFLYPSLHDEASFAVVEASSGGLPVLCLDRGGPPLLGGMPVTTGNIHQTIDRLVRALSEVQSQEAVVLPSLQDRRVRLIGILRRAGFPIAGARHVTGMQPRSESRS